MLKHIRFVRLRLILAISAFFCVSEAGASHLFGADFYYTWISGNTYSINLVVYGDCSGGAFPGLSGATPTVEVYKNTTTLYQTFNLSQSGAGVEVTPVCANQINNTTCNGGTVPGVKKFLYTGTVTLNGPSTNWRFRFTGNMGATQAGRSNSITNINIGGTGSIMVLEATLNNISGNNSNAVYTTIPTPFFCINKPQQYNPGAVDPNSDSLNFNLVAGLDQSAGTVIYIPPYTAAAPLATAAGTFSFSNTTGQLNFTPNLVQNSLVVGRVEEYRNGVLVGTSMREMTFVVLNNCNNNPPDGSISSPVGGTVVGNNTIRVCNNQGTLTFNINPTDIDGDTINVSVAGLPAGAVFNLTNNNTTAPSISFSWNVTGVAPGNYTFFITYTDQGCPLSSKQTVAYTISVLPVPALTFQLISPATCTKKAVFKVTPGGVNSPFVFNVVQGSSIIHTFNGLTGAQTDSLHAGTYTFSIRDANNCQRDTIIILQSPPLPTAGFNLQRPACQGGSNGSITVTALTGTAPFLYALGSGAYSSTNTFSGLSAGNYVIHIRDASECVKDTTIVLQDAPPINAQLNLAKPPCNAFQSGAISVTAQNGTAPYQYALGAGAFGTSNVFSGLASGSYLIHIKDANNCLKDTTVLLPDSIRVKANVALTHVLCNAQNTGSVTLSAYGTNAPYIYSLGSGAWGTSNAFNNLAAGTYVFHIRDVDSCYLDTTLTLNQPTALQLSVSVTDAHCFGAPDGSITVMASGATPAYSYSLNGGTPGSSNVFGGLVAGAYTVTVTDASNCSKNIAANVQQPTPLMLTITPVSPSCNGSSNGSVTLVAAGGVGPYTYALDAGAYGASGSFSGLAAGSYVLHAKDAQGCIKDTSITLLQPTAIVPSALVRNATCATLGDGKVTLSAAGGTPGYTYALGTGAYGATGVFTALAAGSYTFHIKDANGCIKDTVIAIVDSILVHGQVTVTDANCYGESSGALLVTGNSGQSPYTYALATGPYQPGNSFGSLAAGSYVLHIKDANGCIKDTNVTVAQPSRIVPAVALTQPLCFGQSNGSITLSASGGVPAYTWASGSGAYGSSPVFNGLANGTYVLHVKDSHGCIRDTTVTLAQPSSLVINSLVLKSVSCFGQSDGTVTVNAAGGIPAFSYAFDANPFQAANLLTGLNAGAHIIHIKDANGCTKDTTIAMQQPSRLFFGPAVVTMPTCEGFSDGSIGLSGTGGVPPYQFSKDGVNFSSSTAFASLKEGTYTLHVKDANGCTHDTTLVLTGFPHIVIAAPEIDPVRCFGESSGRIVLHVGGGVQPLRYQMVQPVPAGPVVTSPVFENLKAGIYKFTITDDKGCRKDTALVLGTPDKLVLSPSVTANNCEGEDNGGELSVEAKGGTEPYSYLWSTSPAQTTAGIRGLTNGKYMVWVKDDRGCTDSLLLKVEYDNCCKPFIPNAFTPNGDGRNDVYRMRYKGDMQLQQFSIFNRFGQRVFNTIKVNEGWDGTFMGVPQDMGTYYYYIRIVCGNKGDKVVEFKGDVTLIR